MYSCEFEQYLNISLPTSRFKVFGFILQAFVLSDITPFFCQASIIWCSYILKARKTPYNINLWICKSHISFETQLLFHLKKNYPRVSQRTLLYLSNRLHIEFTSLRRFWNVLLNTHKNKIGYCGYKILIYRGSKANECVRYRKYCNPVNNNVNIRNHEIFVSLRREILPSLKSQCLFIDRRRNVNKTIMCWPFSSSIS